MIISFQRRLAIELGIDKAIFIESLRKKGPVKMNYIDWAERFPWVCAEKIGVHFREMKKMGLISMVRDGKLIIFSLNEKRVDEVERGIVSLDKKKPAPSQLETDYSESEIRIAKAWLEYAKCEMPWQRTWRLEVFVRGIRKIKRDLSVTDGGLERILDFVSKDSFWQKNAISPLALFKKSKNGNRKIDNILLAMRPKSDRTRANIEKFKSKPTDIDYNLSDEEKINKIFS